MPDTFTPERRSGDPSATFEAGSLRLHAAPPSLTARDRETLREVRRRYLLAAAALDDALGASRLDIALDALHRISTDTDGQALAAAAALGSR